jgi:deoxyhypusine synthase
MGLNSHSSAPKGARDALFKRSERMPEGAEQVRGIEFNDFQGRPIATEDLIDGMTSMGFQASSVGEAVKIIEEMVTNQNKFQETPSLTLSVYSGLGVIQRPNKRLLLCLATLPT